MYMYLNVILLSQFNIYHYLRFLRSTSCPFITIDFITKVQSVYI